MLVFTNTTLALTHLHCKLTHCYYSEISMSPAHVLFMLEGEPTDQRGRMATGRGRSAAPLQKHSPGGCTTYIGWGISFHRAILCLYQYSVGPSWPTGHGRWMLSSRNDWIYRQNNKRQRRPKRRTIIVKETTTHAWSEKPNLLRYEN